MRELPVEKSGERDTKAEWEYAWQSPPGVTPAYRARLGHGPEVKNAKLRRSTGRGSGPYFWQAAVKMDAKWVVVTTARTLGAVLDAIYDVVHKDLVVPKAAPAGASPAPRKRPKKARAKKS